MMKNYKIVKALLKICNNSLNFGHIMRKPAYLHMQNIGAYQLRINLQLINAFVFTTQIVQFLFCLNSKFQAVAVQSGLCQMC